MTDEDARLLVTKFLRTMEARDLGAAESMMAPGAIIIFPGGRTFADQREMVEASRGRYRWVKKTFDQLDVFRKEGEFIVYVKGTLFGVNQFDVAFEDVRYIDRFAIRDGLIICQEVWNDLAESGVLGRTTIGKD